MYDEAEELESPFLNEVFRPGADAPRFGSAVVGLFAESPFESALVAEESEHEPDPGTDAAAYEAYEAEPQAYEASEFEDSMYESEPEAEAAPDLEFERSTAIRTFQGPRVVFRAPPPPPRPVRLDRTAMAGEADAFDEAAAHEAEFRERFETESVDEEEAGDAEGELEAGHAFESEDGDEPELESEDEDAALEGENVFGVLVRRTREKAILVAGAAATPKDANATTNEIFWVRHPDLRGQKLKPKTALADEWATILKEMVYPAFIAGPSIGPIFDGKDASLTPAFRKNVPANAVISPLAIVTQKLHSTTSTRTKVSQIVVHNTSRGGSNKSVAKRFKKSAVDFIIDYYLSSGASGWPHYVIDLNGVIYGIADETFQTPHSGWSVSRNYLLHTWSAPTWWSDVWVPKGKQTPIDLLPSGERGPNGGSIGIELVILPGPLSEKSYRDEQYTSLARLIIDLDTRHGIGVTDAPSVELLGHEDYAPYSYSALKGREDAHGGWDPGAHRDAAHVMFRWSRVMDEVRRLRANPMTP